MKGKLGVCVLFFAFLGTTLYSDYLSDLLEKGKKAVSDVSTTGKNILKTVGDTTQTLVKTVADPVIQQYVATLPMKKDNPYANKVASVRVGSDIPEDEKQFVRARWSNSVKSALQNLGLPAEKELRIGVACSGGGVRAMIGSLGALVGLQELGILPAVTYMALLSGSTWNMPWWMYGNDIRTYKNVVIENATTGLTARNVEETKWIIDMLLTKYSAQRPMTGVDLFNMLLVNSYFRGFGAEKYKKTLDMQWASIRNGSMPFPICTSSMFAPPIEEVGEWIEFTPVEFGSTYLGGWIPTWAINRRFENGSSTDFYYEHPFLLGVFGSAPGVNLEVAYQHAIKKKLDQLPSPLNSVGDKLVKELLQKQIKVPSIHIEKVKDVGVLPFMTEFNNFTKGMSGVRFSDRELLLLSDGGLLFNNPLPPLLRLERGLDIIIIFDYSAGKGVTEGNELKKIVEYAKNNNIPFPKIDDFSAAGKKAISVFKDADSRVPVIVYMPRTFDPERWGKVKDLPEFAKFKSFLENFNSDECINGGFCKTLNFEYTQEQTKQWSGYTEYCVAASKQELIDALKFAAERKK